jgi:hypothetical protein
MFLSMYKRLTISYIYTAVSFIVIIHSQVHLSTQMFYHARISVVSYLFNRFVHVLELLPRRGPKAFHAFCYALLARHKNELVSVLTGPEKEDMAVCFTEHSSFHLGGEVYLRAEK